MKDSTSKRTSWKVRLTKASGWTAFIFFLVASTLTSNYMPWSWFFATWGVMLVLALTGVLGFCECWGREERISVFYLICPVLLAVAFFMALDSGDIVHAILRFQGYR